MVVVVSLFAIVLTLLLVVGIHEAGHAWLARFFNVKITRVSIGFGKPLLSWQGKRCEWVWAMWPFGGYVRLLSSRIEPVSAKDNQFCFDKKPIWVRCVILLAGAVANILLAWLALMLMLMLGYQQMVPIIANVTEPSIAASAGLSSGDQIKSIAGNQVPSWREVGMQLIMTLGKDKVDVLVSDKTGVERHLSLDLANWQYKHTKKPILNTMGIVPDLSTRNMQRVSGVPLLQALQDAFIKMAGLLYFYLVMLKQLLTGAVPFIVLLGPLGLFTAMIGSFMQGVAVFLYFIASFSLAVALINVLPLPGLDGGSIVYALVEKIRGKPVSVAMEVLLHRLMFIALCLVLVQLLLNDMQRYLH
jgi:regulator of sigma E protease